MDSHSQHVQDLDQPSFDQNSWPPSQPQLLGTSPDIESRITNFLAPNTIPLAGFLETPSLPDLKACDAFLPFQCMDEDVPLHRFPPQLDECYCHSECNIFTSNSAPRTTHRSGSAVNEDCTTRDSSSVPSPLKNASIVLLGNNDVAKLRSLICSLIINHLKRMSPPQTVKVPVNASNDPLLQSGTKTFGRAHTALRSDRSRGLPIKTRKRVTEGFENGEQGEVAK